MKTVFLSVLLLPLVMVPAGGQTLEVSPCPDVFTYEPRGQSTKKWYGVIAMTTAVKLVGFKLDVELDKPADLLGGNWQGDVQTKDNTRFSITSQTEILNPGTAVNLRLFVKYGANQPPPNLVSIKFNGRQICPSSAVDTTTPHAEDSVPVRPDAPHKPPATTPEPSNSANVKCGTVRIQPQALITHGQATVQGQWPWHVTMYQDEDSGLNFICGGSLIGLKAVVTAAHCVTRGPRDRPVDPDSLVLYFGKYHRKLWSDGGLQIKQVQHVMVHPSYTSTNYNGDIAVLILNSAVDYSQFVRPICMWNPSKRDLSDVLGTEGTVVGFGITEMGTGSHQLMQARMPVVDQLTCNSSYPDFFPFVTSNRTFCAGYRNGTSVCNGDSGGGMVFPTKQKDGTNVWFLRGIVSLSPSKIEGGGCDTSHYVVFTDVAKYLPWLTPYIAL